jgi:hypothetical protein
VCSQGVGKNALVSSCIGSIDSLATSAPCPN